MSRTTNTSYDFSDLSDEDIQLLYDIIRQAESSDLPPFRALFTAYDRVLRDYGIQKDHDQIYFRFLLRLGETQGDSLFERFEWLLQRLGFEIKFDDEHGEGYRGTTDQEHTKGRKAAYYDIQEQRNRAENQTRRQPSRRASFDSSYDTKDDSRRSDVDGLKARPPRAHSTDDSQRQQVQRNQSDLQRQLQYQGTNTSRARTSADAPSRGRLKQRKISTQLGVAQRKVSISRTRDHPGTQQHPVPETRLPTRYYELDESEELSEPDEVTLDEAVHPPDTLPRNADPSEAALAQMDSHAKVLRYHHMAAHALGLFHSWRRQAIIKHNKNVQLFQVASNHDARTLLHQALDQWHTVLVQRRREHDIERYFETLYEKAQQARDLFLLTKAFTHWEAAAREEVIRSKAARRHLLRSRYFNAWRNITITNEHKVRATRTKKIINIWKRKTAQVLRHDHEAEIARDNAIVSRCYRHWFWHFCEQRAPTWYSSKLKVGLFSKWLNATRQAQIRDAWATDSRNLELVRSTTAQWSRRSTLVMQNHERAHVFRRRMLIQPNVEALRTEMTLSPLLTRMVRVVDARVARHALKTWILRIRAVAQAAEVCKLRVMRNNWTAWNDRLRCQALSRTIDDRIVMQALYKWVLTQRLKLFQRVRDEKLKTKVLADWNTTMNNACASLGTAFHFTQQSRNKRLQRLLFEKWSSRSQTQSTLNARAETMLDDKQLKLTFTAWSAKLRLLQQINVWATDARFFVLTSRSVKKWQASAADHQRNKRRDAYSVIRRKIKVALARRIFHKWQASTADHAPLHDSAAQIAYQRTLSILPAILQTWHDRSLFLASFQTLASDFHAHTISSTTIALLTAQLTHTNALNERAITFRNATDADVAASALRKINWAVFQNKRQDDTAASLAERNRRRHYKSMLRYWRDGVEKRRRPVGRLLFQSVVGSGRGDGDNYTAGPAMEFEDDLIDFSVTEPVQPTPLVLSSRRSIRNNTSTRPILRPSTAPPSPFAGRLVTSPSQQRQRESRIRPASALPAPKAPIIVPTPGYLRTPSRRSALREAANNATGAQGRNRLQQLRRGEDALVPSNTDGVPERAPHPLSLPPLISTTPAGQPPQGSAMSILGGTPGITPLISRLRNVGLGAHLSAATATANGIRPSRFSVARHTAFSDVDEEIDEPEANEQEDVLSPSRNRMNGGSTLQA